MNVISDYYRVENSKLLESGNMGGGGYKWIPVVRSMVNFHNIKSILDYGCGQGTLKARYPDPLDIREYDPAIPEKSHNPEVADMVVCTDVLEHVEPELLNNVVWDIHQVTGRMALISVATRPSNKSYPDGTNVHLTIEGELWWDEVLSRHFSDVMPIPPIRAGEYAVVCCP